MPSEQKIEKLLRLIIRETTEGNLKWTAVQTPRSLLNGTEAIIEDYFETQFKEQNIAVFERRYREYDPESDTSFWNSQDAFAFLSSDGTSVMWEVKEQSFPLGTLLSVAKESAADVDGILNRLLH